MDMYYDPIFGLIEWDISLPENPFLTTIRQCSVCEQKIRQGRRRLYSRKMMLR